MPEKIQEWFEHDADPVAKRARRNVEHCAFCIRTFVDKESLKKHMQDNHFD